MKNNQPKDVRPPKVVGHTLTNTKVSEPPPVVRKATTGQLKGMITALMVQLVKDRSLTCERINDNDVLGVLVVKGITPTKSLEKFVHDNIILFNRAGAITRTDNKRTRRGDYQCVWRSDNRTTVTNIR